MVEVVGSNPITPTRFKPLQTPVCKGFLMSVRFILRLLTCAFCAFCAIMSDYKQLITPRLRQHETTKTAQTW